MSCEAYDWKAYALGELAAKESPRGGSACRDL